MADLSAGECIRRALSASEIAESCFEPNLRQSFLALSSIWLARAEGGGGPLAQAQSAKTGDEPC